MRKESPWMLFATTVVSHLPMLPTTYLFFKRHYVYEAVIAIFGLTCSLMYHVCQSFNTTIFLSELEWHRLDNITAIAALGMWSVFICAFKNPVIERSAKYFTLIVAILLQEKDPWNTVYTFFPLALFACLPLGVYISNKRLPAVHYRSLVTGLFFMALAGPFFVAGLNDTADPYRFFHGMWHLLGATSAYFLWIMVKIPGATSAYVKGASISVRGDTLL
ncbi:hypothetical protein DQ04_02141090 [Trypanosoma grayi]|uniref:hypothetical protein n=1 Tax=Trypanosoma grayi TaxID=71804 RepID=UPI0004F4BD5C|nr:hypothetical protein DQ04_02141090 [Trypanosoma grayi]KEG11931.1 hypothetical protein DQ04_02141090 [Trypanosoma grayi]